MKQPQQNNKETTDDAPDGARLTVAVLSVMEALSRVMDQETDLLKKQDFEALVEVRAEKAKWMRDYRASIASLTQKPDLLKTVTTEERLRLRRSGEVLAVSAMRNAADLQAAIGATQALVQTIISAAREQNKTNECYVDPRKTPLLLGSYSPLCTPVAVSRTA
ncbi:MAG: hypothetical protein WC612_08500 [Bdellovibrionales bacterium]|jgi:hypothetical protein